jgi:hypothetical protein
LKLNGKDEIVQWNDVLQCNMSELFPSPKL